jgi:hypothetical protein
MLITSGAAGQSSTWSWLHNNACGQNRIAPAYWLCLSFDVPALISEQCNTFARALDDWLSSNDEASSHTCCCATS